MQVLIKYFGFEPLRDTEKSSEGEKKRQALPVNLPEGATVKDLLQKIKEDRTDEEKELLDTAAIMINEEVGFSRTRLSDQDSVLILIPLGGG